ncbi:MAG: hypothetical protein DIJKHBIC_04797 [Thermoanaerobaculia bacterium]|nr:hypothetical protein [Thermoanaerobaculia bacterium]
MVGPQQVPAQLLLVQNPPPARVNVTTVPPAGAGALRARLIVALPPARSKVSAIVTDPTPRGWTAGVAVFVTLPAVAVIVTGTSTVVARGVRAKVVLHWP